MEKKSFFLHMGKASYVTMNNYNNGWRNSLQHQLHDNDYIFRVSLSLCKDLHIHTWLRHVMKENAKTSYLFVLKDIA